MARYSSGTRVSETIQSKSSGVCKAQSLAVIEKKGQSDTEVLYDARLSTYGNDLMQSIGYVIQAVQIMLSRLGDHSVGRLNETEKAIITPGFEKVSGYAEKLKETITCLQIP